MALRGAEPLPFVLSEAHAGGGRAVEGRAQSPGVVLRLRSRATRGLRSGRTGKVTNGECLFARIRCSIPPIAEPPPERILRQPGLPIRAHAKAPMLHLAMPSRRPRRRPTARLARGIRGVRSRQDRQPPSRREADNPAEPSQVPHPAVIGAGRRHRHAARGLRSAAVTRPRERPPTAPLRRPGPRSV